MIDAANVGAIIAFFRDEKPTEDAFCEQISLWSSIAVLALERRRLYEQLSFRAQYDGLTGLPNRALLYERLEAEIALASRSGSLLGILYVDLDGFKETNDVFGHGAGDAVLQEVARRMIHSVRRGDTVGRIGGDEFVVLLPLLGRREDAEHISAKISAALRQPVRSTSRPSVSAPAWASVSGRSMESGRICCSRAPTRTCIGRRTSSGDAGTKPTMP